MQLVNATRMQAGYTLGLDPDGRERVVVVIKGTFDLPPSGQEATLSTSQVPLVMADEFEGEPGSSATRYESDFAPIKPQCDVLLNGSAHAPGGAEAPRVTVGLRVAEVAKSFDVVGDRTYEHHLLGDSPGKPAPFVTKPFSYGTAFGGTDARDDAPDDVKTFADNPVGIGYYPVAGRALRDRPLPSTEETGRPVRNARSRYRPMALGAVGRNFACRAPLAGTYDETWLEEVYPFLPADFDPLHFQAAPPDQQMAFPTGGEQIELLNLTPDNARRFNLPTLEVPVEFTDRRRQRTEISAVCDTLLIEPDLDRFMMTWRASTPVSNGLLDMQQAVVGRMTRAWYRARDLGKTYYPSLAALAAAHKP